MPPDHPRHRQPASRPHQARTGLHVVRVPRADGVVDEALAETHAGLEAAEKNMYAILARISCEPARPADSTPPDPSDDP